jgi:hypothetical protein
MAYADFTLGALVKQFDLTIDETSDLVAHVPAASLDESFLTRLAEDAALALAVSTDKARSEFIIAPILSKLRRMAQCRIGLFSGVEFSVDPAAGLAGVCDFILTRSPEQLFIIAPVLMLVEAKNEDMKRGYAQCVAEMIAAQRFNEREEHTAEVVHGAVTTGNVWRFLRLDGARVNIDRREYHIERVAHIVGILLHLTAVQQPA